MDKSKINLNHFEFKIIKNKIGDRLQTIAVTSKSLYEKLYSDVSLDYAFQSESKFTNIDSKNNIIINEISTTQERSLIATIYARLKRAIKDKKESETKPDNLSSDEFDFSEFDEPEPSIDFTYSCPKCKSGIMRVKTISGDNYHWTCVNTAKCNSVYADFRGRPIGEDLNYIAEIAVDENVSVSNDDFDFDDDVLSKDFNSEETLIDPKHLNDDFDFDEFNDEPESKPQIAGNEKPAQTVFPENFDFDRYIGLLIGGLLEYQKELCETYIETQKILQQQNELQSKFDRLDKYGDRLSKLYDDTQREFEHAVDSKLKTKYN